MFLTRHVYPPRKVGVSIDLDSYLDKSVVFRIISRPPGGDHSRADPRLLGLGERHRLLWRLLGLSSLQGNITSWKKTEAVDKYWVKTGKS